jgi:hypothetical protein
MGKDFMKLLKVYIDKMQEQWEAGDYGNINTLATAISDMTNSYSMLSLVTGHPGCDRDIIKTLSHAAELIIKDEKKNQ